MAKVGNRSTGPKHVIAGNCADCGKPHTDTPLTMIRRFSTTGKGRMTKVCVNCAPKI